MCSCIVCGGDFPKRRSSIIIIVIYTYTHVHLVSSKAKKNLEVSNIICIDKSFVFISRGPKQLIFTEFSDRTYEIIEAYTVIMEPFTCFMVCHLLEIGSHYVPHNFFSQFTKNCAKMIW